MDIDSFSSRCKKTKRAELEEEKYRVNFVSKLFTEQKQSNTDQSTNHQNYNNNDNNHNYYYDYNYNDSTHNNSSNNNNNYNDNDRTSTIEQNNDNCNNNNDDNETNVNDSASETDCSSNNCDIYYLDDIQYGSDTDEISDIPELCITLTDINLQTLELPFTRLEKYSIVDKFCFLTSQKRLKSSISSARNISLYEHESCTMTIAQFWIDFQRLQSTYMLSNSCCESMIEFMKRAFPLADLANVIHLNHSKSLEEYYFNKYFTKETVDVCINGCMVFTGINEFKDKCNNCYTDRYHQKCKICVKNKVNNNCNHSNRISKKSIEYRSIVCLITDLILNHPSFIDLINYFDYESKLDPNNLCYTDIKDGESYIRNMKAMKSNLANYKQNKNHEIIGICLCLSWFYDGCQIYHYLIYNFLPMIFTILNLPPSIRNKIGIGTFMLSINTLSPGSYVELFILYDCFIQELLQLYEGISLWSNGVEYYIQARLICTILDLPALCKVFQFSSMFNSVSGCTLCNWGEGTYMKEVNKVKYLNSRKHLPLRHYLRSLGEKVCNCENNKCKIDGICKLWDKRVQKWFKLFILDDNFDDVSGYIIWYNQDVADIDEIGVNIRDEIAFTNCDYTLSEPYERNSNEFYDKNASFVVEQKINMISLNRSKKQIEKVAINGIKGFSPLRCLPYIRYETDLCQDPAHVLFVLSLMIINIWYCDNESHRMFKSGVKDYYRSKNNCFDCLWDSKVVIPWNFTKKEQLRAQAYMKCILIPISSKDKFNIVKGNIFAQKGIIKGTGKITIITVFMNLILFANLHMSIGYRALFRIFSTCMCRIQNSKPLKNDIYPLFKRINELRSFWEGYIPFTEMIFMLHALEDITMHIPKQGPIQGWHAMNGEQAIGCAKNQSNTNGSSRPELETFREWAKKEFKIASEFYSRLDFDRKSIEVRDIYWNSKEKCYVYNTNRILLEGMSNKVQFCQGEFGLLLESMHREILKYYDNNEEISFQNSSLFRVVNLGVKSINLPAYNHHLCVCVFYESLIETYDEIIEQFKDNEKLKNQNLKKIKISSVLPKCFTTIILDSDIKTIKQILKFQKTQWYSIQTKFSTSFGIRFRGRGFEFSEKIHCNDNIPNNVMNNLTNNFFKKNQYSSWCKIRLKGSFTDTVDYYGQCNYFFSLFHDSNSVLDFPDYDILKNIRFASVSSYKYNCNKIINNEELLYLNPNNKLKHSHLNTIHFVEEQSNNWDASNPSFVSIDEILPTEVVTFGFIDRGFEYKAIYPYEDYNKVDMEEYIEKYIISLNDEKWLWKTNWYLAFIDGSPSNLVLPENNSMREDVEDEEKFWQIINDKYKYW